jgi:PAS domain S-box-containing protein
MTKARALGWLARPRSGRRAHEVLRAIVEATGQATGEAFFPALVQGLAAALGVKHAFVAIAGDPPAFTRARTLAAALDGVLAPNFEYALAGTPCEHALGGGETVFHGHGVASRYPAHQVLAHLRIEAYLGVPIRARDGAKLGILAVMDDRPLDLDLEPVAVAEIFAARAAAELERIRAEDALRAERDFSRAVLDTSVTAVVVIATDRRIVFASERAGRIAGIPAAALVGRPLEPAGWETTTADGRPIDGGAALDAAFGRAEAFTGIVLALTTPGGERRILRVNGAPLLGERGAVRSLVVSLEDVTERRVLEEQLAHAQKMEGVGRLAGGVAHDFNNLLTVILSHAQLAEAELPPGSPLQELVAPIREAAQRGTALTRQLLAFARKQVVSPAVLDLNEVVRGVARLLQRLLGETVGVGVRLSPDLWRVRIDPGQLEQVLVNLAVNARDAMPDGGRLSVATSNAPLAAQDARGRGVPAGEYVELVVTDTGHGMDAATARRAFEPFFTTKGELGTGLGLATCLGIVQQAGGAMWAETAPGRGTAVHVLLPRHAGEAPRTAEATRTPRPAVVGPATVLVVEDEEMVRRTALLSLRRAGYGVLAAASGPEALRVAADHAGPIDLLLSDVVLPGMSGRELAERLRVARPGVRVLFTSGYAEDEALRAQAAAGSVPILPKPYTPEDLAAWVGAMVGTPPAATAPASSPSS